MRNIFFVQPNFPFLCAPHKNAYGNIFLIQSCSQLFYRKLFYLHMPHAHTGKDNLHPRSCPGYQLTVMNWKRQLLLSSQVRKSCSIRVFVDLTSCYQQLLYTGERTRYLVARSSQLSGCSRLFAPFWEAVGTYQCSWALIWMQLECYGQFLLVYSWRVSLVIGGRCPGSFWT